MLSINNIANINNIRFFISGGLLIVLFACSASHFTVENATVRKMVVNESSNADMIHVYLTDVPQDIEFKSIVYNRTQMDVSVSQEGDTTKVTSMKQNGGPVIQGQTQTEVDLPNQLTYMKGSKEYSIQLNELKYLPTKIVNN